MNADLTVPCPDGFDSGGLWGYFEPAETDEPLHAGVIVHVEVSPGGRQMMLVDQCGGLIDETKPRLSMADGATRDRFERWDPLRTFLHALPDHRILFQGLTHAGAVFRLLEHLGTETAGYSRSAWVRAGCVPELGRIDLTDRHPLPDGMLWGDAHAFAAVIRHVAAL